MSDAEELLVEVKDLIDGIRNLDEDDSIEQWSEFGAALADWNARADQILKSED